MNVDQYLQVSGGVLGAIEPRTRFQYLLQGLRMRATPELATLADREQAAWESRARRPQLPNEDITYTTQNFSGRYPNYVGGLCSGITDGVTLQTISSPRPTPPPIPRIASIHRRSTPRSEPLFDIVGSSVPPTPLPQRIPPGTSDTGTYQILPDGGVRRVDQ